MSYSDMTTYHPYMPTTILTTGALPAPMGTAVPPPPPPPLPMNYYMNTIGYYNPTMGYPMQDIHYSEMSVQKAKDVVEQAVPSISTQSIAISTEKKEEKEQTNEESDDPVCLSINVLLLVWRLVNSGGQDGGQTRITEARSCL